uniref:Golgi SNAP receptor complex member 1 n=1 Tax=Amphimedon queenslandica TaxID=400682 RepID=A0A1X7VHS8_AMPQE
MYQKIYKSSSALNRRTELYLKEHEHIRGSDTLADEAISIAMTTKENLSHQRGAFSNITSRMQAVTHRFPLINSVVQKINLRKRRDSLILGAVIAVCLIILLYFIVR